MQLSLQILDFLFNLHPDIKLPRAVKILNPYQENAARHACEQFYRKFYSDNGTRTMILGINPGRFGGGVTGIPFTDPVKLEQHCGIPNEMIKKAELSADFIYRMIDAYGGTTKFYQHYYIGAVSPLGFTLDGQNLNYYDHPALARKLLPFVIDSLQRQLDFGLRREVCFCLGEGENFKFLSDLNTRHGFFEKVIPLPHPRFIMQYRRKKVNEYIAGYIEKFQAAER